MLSDFIAYGEIDLCPCLPVGETMRGEVTLQALYMLFYGLVQLGLMINLQSKDTKKLFSKFFEIIVCYTKWN